MSSEVAYTVRLFARARELTATDVVTLRLPANDEPPTVAELRRWLIRTYPALAEIVARSAVAVNGEFATDNTAIPAAAEIALLPPVSGG